MVACGGAGTEPPSARLLASIARGLGANLAASRKLFLGDRRPGEASCIESVPAGSLVDRRSVPRRVKIKAGGCATFMVIARGRSPIEDYDLDQRKLRGWLQNRLRRCSRASAPVFELSSNASRLAAEIAAWAVVPPGFHEIGTDAPSGSRPALCLVKLNEALRSADLDAAKSWSAELAAACFHVADLHRWLELLDTNMLMALEFQSKCRGLFAGTAKQYRNTTYDMQSSLGRYPAGSLILHGERNYYEVERQAENIFGLCGEIAISREDRADAPAAYAMPPELRPAFRRLRASLSPHNQQVWDRAAGAPYERSYLENILFRMRAANALDAVAAALHRLDRRRPKATSAELLDVVFYRAGGFFSGLEWADRFDPRLTHAARRLTGDDQRLLVGAWKFTHARFDKKGYLGGTLTLRSALDTGSFDCIRATDMIGAIYRNAGGTGFCELRECRGGPSHTVAGILCGSGNGHTVFSVDGLLPNHRGTRTWPNSYFRSTREYCVEVYCRGLDTSLWSGGYIVCGPHAGTRMQAAIPYLPGRETATEQKVFGGPYPKEYTGSKQ